ncbi:hypothetical protein [Sulfurimonas sp.]
MRKDTQLNRDRELLTEMIYKKYNTFNLNKHQYSEVINRSPASISRDMANSRGAAFKKDDNGKIYFPLNSVVNYLLNTISTIDSEHD